MLLLLFAFIMRFVDIPKLQQNMQNNNNGNNNNNNNNQLRCCLQCGNNNCNRTTCMWQQASRQGKRHCANALLNASTTTHSNSSSTSSGCDASSTSTGSAASSCKENYSITPQQLQQFRLYQQLQQQQLQLLQKQLLQRKLLQQQLRAQGVRISAGGPSNFKPQQQQVAATLTCNQQYLLQQRLQQQRPPLDNIRCYQNDMLNNNSSNNNNNNNNNINNNNYNLNANRNNGNYNNNYNANIDKSVAAMLFRGQKLRRGMTEFSTNNDINNKTHFSQPLQNSPRHSNTTQHNHYHHQQQQHYTQNININSPTTAHKQQQQSNQRNNQQTLLLNLTNAATATHLGATTASSNRTHTTTTTTTTPTTSATNSPLHQYRNPFNSPNSTPYASGATSNTYVQQQQQQQLHLQQQQHYLRQKLPPLLTQTQYQQHLADLLQQQQQLQKQQQQLLSANDTDDAEISEESLKQNVAIVLNNLDRYNNALRSIIVNEQVNNSSSICSSSSIFGVGDSFLLNTNNNNNNNGGGGGGNNTNNNFVWLKENKMATAVTPESDYNSNATTPGARSSNMLPCDSNYQQHLQLQQQQQQQQNNMWFLDYGYRDGAAGMQRSVLSSLSASYNGFGDLVYYEDLAKNIDANLAEVDMESFRAEDIHSLLSQLPAYCKQLTSMADNDRFAQSLLIHQQHQQLQQQIDHTAQQQQQQQCMLPALAAAQTMSTTSSNEPIDNSFCKSEILFSPVKESHISVDSLDMDAYPDDGDIILTCKANKDNYTIAFEGSMMYSDDSFYEPNEMTFKQKQNFINLHSNLDDIVGNRKSLDVSMSRSEQQFTHINKQQQLQQQQQQQQQKCYTTQLQRYPSGNNNTANTIILPRPKTQCAVRKSNSLPNLRDSQELGICVAGAAADQLNVSQAISASTMEQCKLNNLLPMCQMPISASVSISERLSAMCHHSQLHQQQRHKQHRCNCTVNSQINANLAAGANGSVAAIAQPCQQQHHTAQQQQKHTNITGSTSSGNSNPPAYNLVKLFIKQKSHNCSSDDNQGISAHTCMDVSSGCWPSSDAAGSSSSSSLEQRLRKKSMHDSGKGSALSRHDEEELTGDQQRASETEFLAEHSTPKKQLRSRNSDAVFYDEDPSSSSTGSLTATNSPAHRRRSMPLRNPQLCQLALQGGSNIAGSGQSTDASHSTSEQLTQVYMASGGAAVERRKSRRSAERQTQQQQMTSAASSSEMITRSMQTSCGSLSTRSSLNDRLRCVPPSFLAKLNKLGDERQAPIYVIYPSYALPDLGFVQTTNASPDVIFSPFNYKMTLGPTSVTGSTIKKRFSINEDDDELLKTVDTKQIVDWQSLATLLPADYRRRLKNIPEVKDILPTLDAELSHKPLFCLTPAVRRNRPHVCDCAKYLQQTEQQQTQTQEGSSSSGSSQQPSSGYRGSSTLLTDSELSNAADPLKQMYVYQYEQQRMDAGVETSPAGLQRPQPMPRGILRKTHSQTATTKRNSMIENQQTKLSKLEKRRSLQEAPHNYAMSSAEELAEVFEEEGAELYATPKPRTERLSRRDLDARARAENFLTSLPRSELKYYAEIAAILESSEHYVEYDAAALKKEVSRVLSQQKKVSFNDGEQQAAQQQQQQFANEQLHKRFSTPPNSPNISMANANVRSAASTAARRLATHIGSTLDEKEMRRIENNRFKRLQIQWEEMSKDTRMLKDLVTAQATKSGDTTPTAAHKSRIPRPVSYPAGKITAQDGKITTTARSPSRIVPPKRYSMAAASPNSGAGSAKSKATSPATPTMPAGFGTGNGNSSGGGSGSSSARSRTPNSRVAVTAPNTPKRSVPRTVTRVR